MQNTSPTPKSWSCSGSEKNKNIKSYLDEYLIICQNRNLSPSTIRGYEKCLSALSALHKFHVSELTPAVLKNWIASRKTKLKTIRNNLSFLRSAIDEAVTDGLLTINPVTLVSASRYHVLDNTPGSGDYEVDPLHQRRRQQSMTPVITRNGEICFALPLILDCVAQNCARCAGRI